MLVAEVMITTRWVLREFMSRYKITNRELAIALDRHETTVSRLRSPDEMPQMGGKDLDELCNALTRILKSKGIDYSVTYRDLLEHAEI